MVNDSEIKSIITSFIDYLLPELTPYETSLYLLILRKSIFENGSSKTRIGKRTMAIGYGAGSRGAKTNYAHMTKLIKGLEIKNCISIGNTTREGTEYTIKVPLEIPLVKEKLKNVSLNLDEDYYNDPEKRKTIFERDKWICQYCGERVSSENATIDHYIPQSKNGSNAKENLKTCCLVCNGIKSGKSYEDAAPHLLQSIQERVKRKNLA